MTLEFLSMGFTTLGWIAILIWFINILFTWHDHVQQSLMMKIIGWLGVLLILIGGGLNYADNQGKDQSNHSSTQPTVQTNRSH